jgi:hypothetical protein
MIEFNRTNQKKIFDRNYYLSSHAEDEMAEDEFERKDIENAILKGRIEKKMTQDIRGTRYKIVGPSLQGRILYIITRFTELGPLIIITVYERE